MLQDSIDRAAGLRHFPIQLSASELAALLAWPIGNTTGITGLSRPCGRQFPPHGAIQSEGLIIGDAAWPGRERPVAIGFKESTMHTDVIGKTGTGKTVMLGHLAKQIMQAEYGLIMMEREGNLYEAALNYIPPNRINDVILLDVSDARYPVGFNILDQGNPLNVIDEIIALFQHKYGGNNPDIWLQEYVYHGMRTIAEHPELTVVDLVRLLNPMTDEETKWVDNLTRTVKDPEIKRWWQSQDNHGKRDQQKRAGPVLSRFWQLTSRPELRLILGQSKSAFQLREVLAQNKILLINLKGVADDTASLFGTMVTQAIWRAAREVTKDRPTYLMYDEFGDYMDMPLGLDSMLAQARKHLLPMILAHQDLTQLNAEIKEAIMTNARNKIVFNAKSQDASQLAQELGGYFTKDDVTGLPNYEAIASILTPIGPSGPVTITTRKPAQSTRNANKVRDLSRKQYGREAIDVYQEIEQRYQPERTRNNRPLPKISGGDFRDTETI